MRNTLRFGLTTVVLALGIGGAAYATFGEVTYSGRAVAIWTTAQVATLSGSVIVADTGYMHPQGEDHRETVVSLDHPVPWYLQSRTLTSAIRGVDNVSTAHSAIEKLKVDIQGDLVITADIIESQTRARCRPTTHVVTTSGRSHIVKLRINDAPIEYTGTRNQRVELAGGLITVILNEYLTPDVNSVEINAVHVIARDPTGTVFADVRLAHTESGILTCAWSP